MTNQECIFCKISKGEIPAKKVFENENYLAFLDIKPASKGHTLVIPKKHYENFLDLPENENSELFGIVQKISKKLKNSLKAELIFLLVMGEEVPHTHVHLIPYYGTMPIGFTQKDNTELDKVLKEIETKSKKNETK